jgi:hypothetical protein
MQAVRRLVVWFLLPLYFAGTIPGALALGCVPDAAPAKAPCPDADCDDADPPEAGCTCILYLAPEAPGSLAVLGATQFEASVAAAVCPTPAPAERLIERNDAPDPPPPR